MTAVQVISGPLEDGLRRELVNAGDLLVFKGVGPMSDLCDLTDELVCEALDASGPVGAQFEIEREDFVASVGALQRRYRKHLRARKLFLAALERAGVDPNRAL